MAPYKLSLGKIERFRTGDIEESALAMQKAMMLVSQASNAITYQRRLELLKGFTDVKAAKGMLVKQRSCQLNRRNYLDKTLNQS